MTSKRYQLIGVCHDRCMPDCEHLEIEIVDTVSDSDYYHTAKGGGEVCFSKKQYITSKNQWLTDYICPQMQREHTSITDPTMKLVNEKLG